MTRHAQPDGLVSAPSIVSAPPVAPGLEGLATAVRTAVDKRAGWRETARLVASELERHLPTPSILTPEQRTGDPETYQSHVLHSERDGSFSIVALVWRPGQVTPIHDHVTWCVFGVIQGMEYEELFTLDERSPCLLEAWNSVNREGDVSGFAPPGDIHRVRNAGDRTAISIHIYGTDVSRIGSSVRRYYDLSVRPAGSGAVAARGMSTLGP
jgi:3-mercaptopropionate dioxygenase